MKQREWFGCEWEEGKYISGENDGVTLRVLSFYFLY